MQSIRVSAVAAIVLAGLALGCQRPNLESTGGGYSKGVTPETASAQADTGLIAPHEGPAPVGAESPAGEGGPAE